MSDQIASPDTTSTLSSAPDPASELRAELARLREQFGAIEQIDRQTSDMVARLADVVRSSAEIRAKTSLDIGASLLRCEEMIAAQIGQQRDVMSSLLGDIEAARDRVVGLSGFAAALEGQVATLQQRIVQSAAEIPVAAAVAAAPVPPVQIAPVPEPPVVVTWFEAQAVPSAAAALSLQRYAAGIPDVTAAITRAFGGGVIRMEIRARRQLSAGDFESWPDASLQLLEESAGVIQMRVQPRVVSAG